MGHGKGLTATEKGQIIAMNCELLSIRSLAAALNRASNTVDRFLRRHDEQKRETDYNGQRKITDATMSKLLRLDHQGKQSARELCNELKLELLSAACSQYFQHVLHWIIEEWWSLFWWLQKTNFWEASLGTASNISLGKITEWKPSSAMRKSSTYKDRMEWLVTDMIAVARYVGL